MPLFRKVNKDFFKKWSHDMAYVLGFFAADGYITHNKRGASFWSIQITDKELLYEIRKASGSEHTISARIRTENESTIYRLQIGSKEMVKDLDNLGFRARKTHNMKIPSMPKKYLADFIRGYFDGDGNVWVGNVHKERKTRTMVISTVFTSCSKEFLAQLKEKIGSALSIDSGSLIAKSGCKAFQLKYSIIDSLKLYDFMYNREILKTSRLFLNRKKVVFENYIHLRS